MSDPRAERSRQALRSAFNAMVVATPYAQIRVHAIVAAAGVSRSTFYELFASKDALLQENGCLVLRFLAEDLGKHLDATLDAILRAVVHRRRSSS